MKFIHIVMFNTVPEGEQHQTTYFVKSYDMLNEAEDATISLNSMHQAEPSYGREIGEWDFYYVKSYPCRL